MKVLILIEALKLIEISLCLIRMMNHINLNSQDKFKKKFILNLFYFILFLNIVIN
jgi:hypothetical protein